MSGKIKLIGIVAMVVLIALIGLIAFVPYLIDKDRLRISIEEGIERSTGVNFDIKELTLDTTLFHGIQAHLNTTTITDMDGDALGDIGNVTVQIRYLPLLTRRTPEIAKIHIRNVYFPVGENSIFEVLDLKLEQPEPTGFIRPAELKNAEILITDFLIEDFRLPEYVNPLYPEAKRFWLDGKHLSIKHLMSNRNVTIDSEGQMVYLTQLGERRPVKINVKEQLPIAKYRIFAELPHELFEKGDPEEEASKPRREFMVQDLKRLEVTLTSEDLPFVMRYRLKSPTLAEAEVKSGWLDLEKAEALVYQLSDTFSLPLPERMKEIYLAGLANLDTTLMVRYPPPPQKPDFSNLDITAKGGLKLRKAAVATKATYPNYMMSGLSGGVQFKDTVIGLEDVSFRIGELPLTAEGTVNLDTQRMNLAVGGDNIRLAALKTTLQDLGVDLGALQGMSLAGVLDADVRLTGTTEAPVYQGEIALAQGRFQDESLGLAVSGVTGELQFAGSGLESPQISYEGYVNIAQGRYDGPQAPVAVGDISGRINLQGRISPGADFQMPDYSGFLNIAQGRYQDPETGLLVENVAGRLNLGERIQLENFRGYLAGEEFRASGWVADTLDQYQIGITGQDINIQRFRERLLAALAEPPPILYQLQPYQGTADVRLQVATGANVTGQVVLNRVALETGVEGQPLEVPRLVLDIQGERFTVQPTEVRYGDITLALQGAFGAGQYRVAFDSERIPVAFFRDNSDLIMMFTGLELPEIFNTAGSLALDGSVSNTATQISVYFNDAGLSWRGGDFPVYDINGKLYFEQVPGGEPVIATRDLTLRYGNSPIAVDVDKSDRVELVSRGVLSRLAVNHFLGNPRSVGMPYEKVPFHVAMSGALGSLLPGQGNGEQTDLVAELFLDLTPMLTASDVDATLAENQATVRETPRGSESETGDIPHLRLTPVETDVREPEEELAGGVDLDEDNAYFHGRVALTGHDLAVQEARLHLPDGGELMVEGEVQGLLDPEGRNVFTARILTEPPISLKEIAERTQNEIFKDMQGTFAADVLLSGSQGLIESITGWVTTDNVRIPGLTLRELTGRVDFQESIAVIDISRFLIPGVDAAISATAPDLSGMPVTLEDVRIQGPLLSVASLIDFQKNVLKPVIVDQIARDFSPAPQPGEPSLPIQFRNAAVAFDEVIHQNIILGNVAGDFSLYANGFFELDNTTMEAAGGRAEAYLSMSPKDDNFMTLELKAMDVSANALTRALLDVTNQIFGRVDATVRFTTFGEGDAEMLANANGTADVVVRDGRLPAIAKVETLLTAANIFRGGLLGLNLNNIFRTLQVYETDYFAEMSGSFQVAEGVMYTEDLLSDGENLDLFIQGTIGMQDGAANLLVTGLMSQDVSGALGPLGNLSLGRILDFIPGLGSIGQRRGGLLGWIPGVGYVPGFGGPAGDYNRFQVRLVGEIEGVDAIRDFRWISPTSTTGMTEQ